MNKETIKRFMNHIHGLEATTEHKSARL